MPIYEYRCKSCGKEFEVIQQFGDGVLRKCRDCSGRLEKLISRAAFQLKGGGWYDDGYGERAKKKKPAAATSESKTTDTPKKKKTSSSSKKD